jgi:hypothetical protein
MPDTSIQSTQLAITTARSGSANSGSCRSGFAPNETQGETPGSQGPFYVWRQQYPPVTTWTRVS